MVIAYATVDDVADGFRELSANEATICEALVKEAAVIIDAYAPDAPEDRKQVVTCRMVRRIFANMSAQSVPVGAMQGTVSAGPYSQSWTLGNGASAGEMYLGRTDKLLLGVGDRIGARSPLEDRPHKCGACGGYGDPFQGGWRC